MKELMPNAMARAHRLIGFDLDEHVDLQRLASMADRMLPDRPHRGQPGYVTVEEHRQARMAVANALFEDWSPVYSFMDLTQREASVLKVIFSSEDLRAELGAAYFAAIEENRHVKEDEDTRRNGQKLSFGDESPDWK